MKILYLLRHGHAEPDRKDDKTRKLSKQGIVQVQKVATLFKRSGLESPEYVLSSGAVRTKETCSLFLQAANISAKHIEFKDELYLANEMRIIHELEKITDEFDHLLYVGHNPGIEQVAASLSEQFLPMGTATLIVLKFEMDEWAIIGSTSTLSVDVLEP